MKEKARSLVLIEWTMVSSHIWVEVQLMNRKYRRMSSCTEGLGKKGSGCALAKSMRFEIFL